MASLIDLIGQPASPQGTAMNSTPDSLKSMFMPLMESMIRDATLRNDPISKLGDTGMALLDATGSGTPFAKSLAPLDALRQNATGGAMNMFLQVMGLDKQLKTLENEAAYRTETLRQGDERLALEKRRVEADDWQPMTLTTPSGATRIGRFNKKTGVFEESAAAGQPGAPPPAGPQIRTRVSPSTEIEYAPGSAPGDRAANEVAAILKQAERGPQFVGRTPGAVPNVPFELSPDTGAVPAQSAEATPRSGEVPPQNLTGKSLIDWLSKSPDYGPQYARNVQMVGDYDGKIPAMYGRKPELLLHFKGLLSQYNPDFQEDKYDRRRQAEKAFQPGGQIYNNITNIRQIFPHLETLTKAVDALNNGDFRALNAATAAVRKQAGQAAITNMEQAARVVGLEAMRVFRQVGASEAEAQDFAKTLSTASSPQQLAGVIGQLHEQLGARLKSHSEAYKEATRAPSRPEGRPFDMLPGDLGKSEKYVTEWVKKRVGAELTQEQITDPSQRIKGTVYKTPRGPLMWDGERWVKPR